MRIALSLLFMAFTTSFLNAGDLDGFKLLFKQVKKNYKTALLSSNSVQQRDYVRSLGQLKSTGSEIARNISRYKRYDEINDMRISQCCGELMGLYNDAKSRPAHYAKYAGCFDVKAGSGAPTGDLRSTSDVEAKRRGALFLLGKWINQLEEYGYPDIEVPNESPAVKYSLLLNQFKLGAKVLLDEKVSSSSSSSSRSSGNNRSKKKSSAVSDWVKDDVRLTFRRFAKVASSLQKQGMRNGFSITKYVSRLNSYIESASKINRFLGNNQVGKEMRDDYAYAMSKLESFGAVLADSAATPDTRNEPENRPDRDESSSRGSLEKMFSVLSEHRERVIDNDPNVAGLSYDAETIKRYLATLSKREYAKYKSVAKSYMSKGYDVGRSKTTAIKVIHSYTKAKKVRISSSELTALLEKLGLSVESESEEDADDHAVISYGSETRGEYSDELFQKLKALRSAILKMNTNISGRAIDNSSISKYEKTLSKKEKKRYKKQAKQYSDRGYGEQAAKSSAINLIHSLFVSKSVKISSEEMSSILESCEKLLKKTEEF